jgi:hypothetical protein
MIIVEAESRDDVINLLKDVYCEEGGWMSITLRSFP